MTDVTITGYLLAANLSSQQSGRKADKGFFPQPGVQTLADRWQCATTKRQLLAPALAEEGWRLFFGFN